MKFLLALTLLFAYSSAQVIGTGTSISVNNLGPNDVIRAIQVNWYPVANPRAFEVRAAQLAFGNRTASLDGVRFFVNTFNDASIYFQYYKAVANLPTPGVNAPNPIADAAASTFALVIKKYLVFEYLDLDGVPGYQFGGADNITGSYVLGHVAVQWKAPVINTTVYTGPNGRNVTVHVIVWETVDEVYYIRWVVADFPITYNGIVITPNAAKIDIGIRWFDNPKHVPTLYTTGPSDLPNARVGLIALVGGFVAGAAVSVSHSNTTTNGNFSIASNTFNGSIDYVQFANTTQKGVAVAGTAEVRAHVVNVTNAPGNITVEAAAFAAWTLRVVAFSFDGVDRPQEVFWDPTVGGTPDNAAASSTVDTNGQQTSTPISAASPVSVVLFALFVMVVALL